MKGQSKTSGCREAAKTFKNRLTLSEALDVAVIGDLPLCNPVPQVFRKVYFTHVYLGQIRVCTHVNYKKKNHGILYLDQGIRVNMHSQSQKETVVMEILGRTMNILRF